MTAKNLRRRRPALVYRTISFLPNDFNALKERQRKLARARGRNVSNSEALADMLAERGPDDSRAP